MASNADNTKAAMGIAQGLLGGGGVPGMPGMTDQSSASSSAYQAGYSVGYGADKSITFGAKAVAQTPWLMVGAVVVVGLVLLAKLKG
jgi:hypothetical protein